MDKYWHQPPQKLLDFQEVAMEHCRQAVRTTLQFQRRQQRLFRFLLLGAALVFVWSVALLGRRESHPVKYLFGHSNIVKPTSNLVEAIRALFEPLKLSPTTPHWIDHETDGKMFSLPHHVNYTWTEPLGKRVAIIDVDTRQLDGEHDLMLKHEFKWESFTAGSSGRMNHYLYSLIHGYDYRLINFKPFDDDLKGEWSKPHALLKFMQHNDYDFVVVMDADAVVHYPEIPLEWLMNRWEFTQNTSFAMAIDPHGASLEHPEGEGGENLDSKGKIYDNTGFIIAHNIPRTHEILRDWLSCPTNEEKYPGCERFKNNWPAEQGAFGEYIRYQFNKPEDLIEIPCDEANGYPGRFEGCKGRFVRHPWSDKESVKRETNEAVMRVLMKQVWTEFRDDEGTLVVHDQKNTNATRVHV